MSVLCFEKDTDKNKQGLTITDWGFVAFCLFLAIGVLIGNSMIISIMARVRKLHTISNYLIMQLAIADFGLGISLVYQVPIFIDRSLVADPQMCALRYAILFLPGYASLLGLLAVTIDRYLAIMDPFRYQRIQMGRYFATYVIGVWVPAIILGIIIPMTWHNRCPIKCDFVLVFTLGYLQYFFIPIFIAITLPLTTLCVHILIKAKQQLRSIVDHEAVFPGEESVKYIKGQFKIFKAGMAVIFTFYVCWVPFFLILMIQVYSGALHDTTLGTCRTFCMCLSTINSMTNPLIYGFRLPDLKAELRKLFHMSNNNVAPLRKQTLAPIYVMHY